MTALRCSFCNRTVSEVEQIISGPNLAHPVYICNECVRVCTGILRDGTGQDDAIKRFKLRRPIYDSLPFTIALLIVVDAFFCVRAYFTGGVSHLEQTAVIWGVSSVVAIMLGRLLRSVRQINK